MKLDRVCWPHPFIPRWGGLNVLGLIIARQAFMDDGYETADDMLMSASENDTSYELEKLGRGAIFA